MSTSSRRCLPAPGTPLAFLDDLKLTADTEEYLAVLSRITDVLGLEELSYGTFVSATTPLSSEELALRRSLLRLKDAQTTLHAHLASVRLEEELINEWTQTLQSHPSGAETASLARKNAQLSAKSQEYQKELENAKASAPADRPPMSVSELVEYKDRLKQKDQELKLKRARIQAYQGLPPNLALARLELQRARDEHMDLVQLRERLLGAMAQNVA